MPTCGDRAHLALPLLGSSPGQLEVDVLEARLGDLQQLEDVVVVRAPRRSGRGRPSSGSRSGSRSIRRRATVASVSPSGAGRPFGHVEPDPRPHVIAATATVAGVPSATIDPAAITATRFARYWASSMKWVVRKIVLPIEVRFFTISHALPARVRIEAGGRLVEEQELRVPGERHGHVQAALLTSGELVHARVPLLRETRRGRPPRPRPAARDRTRRRGRPSPGP